MSDRGYTPICEEGDYVLIRAKVARANDEVALVCIEHTRDGDVFSSPFTLVVERASIASVEVRQ